MLTRVWKTAQRTTAAGRAAGIRFLANEAAAVEGDAVAKVPLVTDSVFRARLEEHYYNTVLEDLMVLHYDHNSAAVVEKKNSDELTVGPAAIAAEGSAGRRAGRAAAKADRVAASLAPGSRLQEVYSRPLQRLITQPQSDQLATNLLTVEASVPAVRKRRYRKLLYNPIDYTGLSKEKMLGKEKEELAEEYAPTPEYLPKLKQIVLKIWTDKAIGNKSVLLSALMSLQSITGVKADVLYAEKSDSSKRIREGMALGARVELRGVRMYEFLDKMTQVVLPRIREFEGVVVDGNVGEVVLPEGALGYFPDVEGHFDQYPHLFETQVLIEGTGDVKMLLSGFQVPVIGRKESAVEVDEDMDEWERVRKATSKEERKKLQEEIMKKKKKQK